MSISIAFWINSTQCHLLNCQIEIHLSLLLKSNSCSAKRTSWCVEVNWRQHMLSPLGFKGPSLHAIRGISAISKMSRSCGIRLGKPRGRGNLPRAPTQTLQLKSWMNIISNVSTDPKYQAPTLKSTASQPYEFFTEIQIFHLLDHLKPTSAGIDGLPSWFLRIAAPLVSRPLKTLFNLSVSWSVVPNQWKTSVITPVAKTPRPTTCSDFRPISVTPILSRLLEKLVVRKFFYPIYDHPMFTQSFSDQFAFRPTGSTTCALINLNHIIADLLQTHPYVHLIALDFSKAFDTVRHSTLLDKCRRFPLLDSLYNWLAKYLEDRQHVTKFGGMLSDLRRITASIVQGSGIGPTAFVLTASDLRALSLLIFLNKYADDCYLIVPPDQASLISSELEHIEKWAQDNNLKLNVLKTKEMIVRRPRTRLSDIPLPAPGIERVSNMKILGVWYEEDFSFRGHVEQIVTQCNQSLYAVRTLVAQGLSGPHLWDVTKATVVSRIAYASPAWWGLLDEGSRQRLQALITKMIKQSLLPTTHSTMKELCDAADSRLFSEVLGNPHHVLHHLLPPVRHNIHNMRQRSHNRIIPLIKSNTFKKTFINRMVLKDCY